MRRRIALAVMAASLSLASCATTGISQSTQMTIAKSAGTADGLYIAAYQAGVAAVKAGKLSRADFLTYEGQAYLAILLIRSAQTIAELTAAQSQLAAATSKLQVN